jgi:hypothetical protein
MRRTCTLLRWQSVIFMMAIAAAPLRAQDKDEDKSPAVDPSGTWRWEVDFGGNIAEFSLKLDWDGEKLTGTYTAFDQAEEIKETKFEDGELAYTSRREFQGNVVEAKFRGKVEDDAIAGKVTVEFGGDPMEYDWNPKRSVEIEDVVGVWQLRLETPNGDVVEPKLTVSKKDKGIEGAYSSPLLGEHDAEKIALKDGLLTWELNAEINGNAFSATYKGKPRGKLMKGTIELSGGNFDGMPFTAKRLPEKKTQ